MHIRIFLELFEKYKCSGIELRYCFFGGGGGQSSRYVSNEQPCLKTTGLYEDLLLSSSLTFSMSYSVLPFHLVCFPISPSLFFLMFTQAFIKCSRKAFVYIYINSMYNIYILENL